MRTQSPASATSFLQVLLAVLLLLASASVASAYNLRMEARNLQESYSPSDTITLDVFLDAPPGSPGITLLSVAVLSTDVALTYDFVASSNNGLIIHPAPPIASGTTGGRPAYVLYSPAVGMTGAATLYPQQGPAWAPWPSPPAGKNQVNINYAEPTFGTTAATGFNIWIGTLVYHIANEGFIELSFESSSIVTSGLENITSQVTLSQGIEINVPEPSTALLIGLGLLGLGAAGSRKR